MTFGSTSLRSVGDDATIEFVRTLADLVDAGCAPAELATAWDRHHDQARRLAGEHYAAALRSALDPNGRWDDAAEAFATRRLTETELIFGRIRMMEGEPASMGMLLLVHNARAQRCFERVHVVADKLGTALFGSPCDFHGRTIEYYDVLAAHGQPSHGYGARIAFFAPHFFDADVATAAHVGRPRSLLFSNVMVERFARLTLPWATDHLRIDGKRFEPPNTDTISDALWTWGAAHELIHGSGPLPMFGGYVSKIALGMPFAAIEEARTDLTFMLVLLSLGGLLSDQPMAWFQVFLADRILRSAKVNGIAYPCRDLVDGENGSLILSILEDGGAVRPRTDVVEVDTERAQATIQAFLSAHYDAEATAVARPPGEARAFLESYARSVRASAPTDGERIVPSAAMSTYLRNLPTIDPALPSPSLAAPR